MNTTPIEGIIDYQGPSGGSAGYFELPTEFDQKKMSANWVKVGPMVDKAQQFQPILGTTKAAQGWVVWKYPKGHKTADKPHKVVVSTGEFILMWRPKHISETVNAIYGNVSKRHLVRQQAETIPVAPGAPADSGGVLTNDRITRESGLRDFGDDYVMNVPQNPEQTAAQVTAPPSEATLTPTE